eukprot:31180-Pelagococcus_subviridis.AAC.3
MRVEPRVLHGQHPRDVVGLVVMRVPPPGRGHEHAAGGPVASNRVDDGARRVDLFPHERVHVRRRGHREVERDGVVPVRALDRSRGDRAVPLALRRRVSNLLHLRQHALALEHRRLELLPVRLHAEVVHQRLVVDPIQRRAAHRGLHAGVRDDALGVGHDEEVALAPRHHPVFALRDARAADDVERLRRRDRGRVQALADTHARERRHQVRRRAVRLDLEAVVDVERDHARVAGLVKGRGVHEHRDGRHDRVRRRAVLEDVRRLRPLGRVVLFRGWRLRRAARFRQRHLDGRRRVRDHRGRFVRSRQVPVRFDRAAR